MTSIVFKEFRLPVSDYEETELFKVKKKKTVKIKKKKNFFPPLVLDKCAK